MTIRALTLLLAVTLLASPAVAADPEPTLKKIKRTSTIALGYRESSRPFSFVGEDGKPAGYSVDLCTRVAAAVGKELALASLQTKWVKLTVENRMPSVVNGTVDLECGSTTASLKRQEQVDFSLTTFITGASLVALSGSNVGTDLASVRIAIIPGTTTEAIIKDAMARSAAGAFTCVTSPGKGCFEARRRARWIAPGSARGGSFVWRPRAASTRASKARSAGAFDSLRSERPSPALLASFASAWQVMTARSHQAPCRRCTASATLLQAASFSPAPPACDWASPTCSRKDYPAPIRCAALDASRCRS